MDKLITGVDEILDSLENGGDLDSVAMNEWQELLLKHPNGVPISNINSGEQWDLPNGWSPYQFLLIKTLIRFHEENFGQNPTYKRLALHLATKWLQTNYCAYKANGGFYEKYSVTGPRGELGGGGPEPQAAHPGGAGEAGARHLSARPHPGPALCQRRALL